METRTQITGQQQNIPNVGGRAVPSDDRVNATKRAEKILSLYLEGVSHTEIAKRMKMEVRPCITVINQAKQQFAEMDAGSVRSLLGSLWFRVLRHSEESSRELVVQRVELERKREAAAMKGDTGTVGECNAAIRRIITELQSQDKSIIDTLTRVGVPRMLDDEDDGSHPPSSILIDYDEAGAENAEISLLEDRVKKLKRLRGKG